MTRSTIQTPVRAFTLYSIIASERKWVSRKVEKDIAIIV